MCNCRIGAQPAPTTTRAGMMRRSPWTRTCPRWRPSGERPPRPDTTPCSSRATATRTRTRGLVTKSRGRHIWTRTTMCCSWLWEAPGASATGQWRGRRTIGPDRWYGMSKGCAALRCYIYRRWIILYCLSLGTECLSRGDGYCWL